ncbi:HNH endonuclease [compost metagenome]
MSPEVDHIMAVSKDGTNQSDNLQVLCALCNRGKGDGGGVRSTSELRYCHLPIEDVPRGHRMALLYYRLAMDKFTCTACGSKDKELTVRMDRSRGLVTLTNLRSICYACIASDVTLGAAEDFH